MAKTDWDLQDMSEDASGDAFLLEGLRAPLNFSKLPCF